MNNMAFRLLFSFLLVLFIASNVVASDTKTLHMGYHLPSFYRVSQKDIRICLDFWAKELGRKTGLNVVNHFYKNIDMMKTDLMSGKIDTLNTSLPLFASSFDLSFLSPGFKLVCKGQEEGVEMLLLVNKSCKSCKSIQDLRSKVLARIQGDPLEKLYLDLELLQKFHIDMNKFFRKVIGVKKYHAAIVKVFFNKADVALVSRRAYALAIDLNPQIARKMKIIHHFTIKVTNGTFFRKSVKLRQNMDTYRDIALNLYKTARGKQILEVFGADYILENSLEDIVYIRNLQKKRHALEKSLK